MRLVIAFAFLAVVVLTVLPPAGSTDSISYAASGRTAVLGHSPYVMTPLQLARTGDPVGRQIPFREIPSTWTNTVSVYGPVATGAEWIAAELGGTSLPRITFWLKLEEALAFGAVMLILDRMLRNNPEMRLRAHLLWSVNPLLLWEIVAGGHIDGLAAVFGLLGVAALRSRSQQASAEVGVGGAALSGLLIGVAVGIKVEYVLLGAAVAWACRRSLKAFAAAAAGFLVVVGAGLPGRRDSRGQGARHPQSRGHLGRHVPAPVAAGIRLHPVQRVVGPSPSRTGRVPAVRRRRPAGPAAFPRSGPRPAGRRTGAGAEPGLAFRHRLPATLVRRDGHQPARPVLDVEAGLGDPGPLFAGATVYAQAIQSPVEPHWLYDVVQFDGSWLTPAVRFLAVVALVWLCVSGRWGWRSSSVASSGRRPELLPVT